MVIFLISSWEPGRNTTKKYIVTQQIFIKPLRYQNWYNHLFGTKSHLQAFLNTSFLWILSILLLTIILTTYKHSIVTLILKQTQPIVFHSTFPSKYFLLFLLSIMFKGLARITCFSNQIPTLIISKTKYLRLPTIYMSLKSDGYFSVFLSHN